MARTSMTMSSGGKIAEHMSVGILARIYRLEQISGILEKMGQQSQRVRDLPREVLVYYIIALGLYMAVSTGEVLRCLVEGMQWLGGGKLRIAGKTGISKARTRLGAAPMKTLWEESARLLSKDGEASSFYRGLRIMAIDGSTLDVPDTKENLAHFGKPNSGRGEGAYPQMRFVSLCECGTHTIYAVRTGTYRSAEGALGAELMSYLKPGMLCLADRLYTSYCLWQKASSTGAQLLWRTKRNALLPAEKVLEDGSYLSRIYPSPTSRQHKKDGILVRVIDYQLEGLEEEPLYRLITTLIDPKDAPAKELAALYSQRWEIESVFDEFKTHLRGGRVVLRSKTPELVEQEFYGMMLAHRAVRTLMYEAAQNQNIDPDRLSFTHTLRVVRRKLAATPALSPSGSASLDGCFA
jgi:hypothetical protein